MRVLLQGRSAKSVASTPGGDQVQLEETARALRAEFGVDAVTSSELEPDLRGFDVVHLFGLVRPQEVWIQARNARRQNVPVVLSTVYCDVWDFERTARTGALGFVARNSNRNVVEALKAAARGVRSREWSRGSAALFTRGFRAMQDDILQWTSVFLPNSVSEWNRIRADFAFDLTSDDSRVVVVPNGVDFGDLSAAEATPVAPSVEAFAGCVLSVARIEGRKNQLALIEAVAGTELTLVLAGKPSDNQPGFIASVHAAARRAGNVHILGTVSHQIKRDLYRVARVHALPSWMETTGLSSLEASVYGCSLVVSPNGDTKDYFEDEAEYCDPSDVASIRAALLRAIARPPSDVLRERVRSRYTWSAAAAATSAAYAVALSTTPAADFTR